VSEAVHCDVCGLVYNSSYLSAHKRRAHPEEFKKENSGVEEAETILQIVSLFRRLSPEARKLLLTRLQSDKKIA
jgi:hypothetical protein